MDTPDMYTLKHRLAIQIATSLIDGLGLPNHLAQELFCKLSDMLMNQTEDELLGIVMEGMNGRRR